MSYDQDPNPGAPGTGANSLGLSQAFELHQLLGLPGGFVCVYGWWVRWWRPWLVLRRP
jgi:hypothetical protein